MHEPSGDNPFVLGTKFGSFPNLVLPFDFNGLLKNCTISFKSVVKLNCSLNERRSIISNNAERLFQTILEVITNQLKTKMGIASKHSTDCVYKYRITETGNVKECQFPPFLLSLCSKVKALKYPCKN